MNGLPLHETNRSVRERRIAEGHVDTGHTTTPPTCPECEKGQMHEDDHVWICPACDYETSEFAA